MGKEIKMDNNGQIISDMTEVIMLSIHQIKNLEKQKLHMVNYIAGRLAFEVITQDEVYACNGSITKTKDEKNLVYMGELNIGKEKLGEFSIKSLENKTFDATLVYDGVMCNFNFSLVNGKIELIENKEDINYKDDDNDEPEISKNSSAFVKDKKD